MGHNCGDSKAFQIMKIIILRITLRKLQNSKKKSENKNVSEYCPRNVIIAVVNNYQMHVSVRILPDNGA